MIPVDIIPGGDRPIMGIDPGKKGAIAFIVKGELFFHALPYNDKELDAGELASILLESKPAKAIVERVALRPMQAGAINMITNYGRILGVLATLGIPYVEVPAVTWKKRMNVSSDKRSSIATAIKVCPTAPRDDGVCEAILLAEYGRLYA